MQISDKGLALTKSFEGLRLSSYRDCAGIWTIGYGHTGHDVYPGMVITQEQADALLRSDMAEAEHAVKTGITVPLNQNQFDALVDFAYNLGIGSFLHSTLREKINNGDFEAATQQFLLWDHAAGEVEPGLLHRRQAEAALFKS